jgi:hypothetical protein
LFGEANGAGLGDPLEARSDVDAVAHHVAVALLNDVADMNADPEFDAAIVRYACVAFDHGVLHFDSAAHRVDHAAKLDQRPIAGTLEDTPIVHGDGGVDKIAAQRTQPSKRAVFICACQAAESDHVGGQYRGKFSDFGHRASLYRPQIAEITCQSRFCGE